MNVKAIVSVVLIVFVAASLLLVVLKETGGNGASAEDGQGTEVAAAGSAAATPAATQAAAPPAATPGVDYDPDGPERQVTAYYFCNTVRCPSCHKIETWSHSAVTSGFEDELEEGRLRWQLLNTDLDEYAHYVDDYELFTKQVVLVEWIDGERGRWRNLDQVWDLLGSEERFSEYIDAEVRRFLAGDEPAEGVAADGSDSGESRA